MSKCSKCDGKGVVDCPKCDGKGEIWHMDVCTVLDITNPSNGEWRECKLCNGNGTKTCSDCNGTGKN
jgi:DnaJ-class molecular chaperone